MNNSIRSFVLEKDNENMSNQFTSYCLLLFSLAFSIMKLLILSLIINLLPGFKIFKEYIRAYHVHFQRIVILEC